MVPFCHMTHCVWHSLQFKSLWADVIVSADQVAMISFSYFRLMERASTMTLYIGGRYSHQLKNHTDFAFPFMLPGISAHLHYSSDIDDGSLFRMLFTMHKVVSALKARVPCTDCKGIVFFCSSHQIKYVLICFCLWCACLT